MAAQPQSQPQLQLRPQPPRAAEADNDNDNGVVAYYDADFAHADLAPIAAPALAAIPTLDAAAAQRFLARADGAGAAGAWEAFYKLHARSASVYKPRRYLPLAFAELLVDQGHDGAALLEVGCGLGSSLAAVLERNPSIRCYACDLSETALELLRAKLPPQHAGRVQAFRCDVAAELDVMRAHVQGYVDFALCVFTLSAIDPRRHVAVLRHLHAVLRPGSGMLLFRDYGLYDTTQLRSKQRLEENLIARQDGTLSYFFTPERFARLLQECGGWEVVECKYACVRNLNRSTGQVMDRVFLHAKAHAKARAVDMPTEIEKQQDGCR